MALSRKKNVELSKDANLDQEINLLLTDLEKSSISSGTVDNKANTTDQENGQDDVIQELKITKKDLQAVAVEEIGVRLGTRKIKKHITIPNWIKHGFPPPEFLRFNFAGINISDHSVKICKTSFRDDHYQIEILDTIALPKGAIVNGDIIEPQGVIDVFRKIKSAYGLEFVRLSIPEEKVYLFPLSIPITDVAKLRSVVEFHVGDHIPMSVDDVDFDFDVVGHASDVRTLDLIVNATPKTVVTELMDLLNETGLVALSLEVEAQAIARAIINKEDNDTYLVIDLGRSRTGISIVDRGLVHYTTTVKFGGDELVEKISKHRGVDLIEAENIKQTSGVQLDQYSDLERESVVEVLGNLVREIKLRESYWLNQAGTDISAVYLVGGNASTPGLTSYLEDQCNIKVMVPNIWSNVLNAHDRPVVSDNESLGYAAVIGLAINENK